MTDTLQAVRAIVASSLDWDQAHATFDAAVVSTPNHLHEPHVLALIAAAQSAWLGCSVSP